MSRKKDPKEQRRNVRQKRETRRNCQEEKIRLILSYLNRHEVCPIERKNPAILVDVALRYADQNSMPFDDMMDVHLIFKKMHKAAIRIGLIPDESLCDKTIAGPRLRPYGPPIWHMSGDMANNLRHSVKSLEDTGLMIQKIEDGEVYWFLTPLGELVGEYQMIYGLEIDELEAVQRLRDKGLATDADVDKVARAIEELCEGVL